MSTGISRRGVLKLAVGVTVVGGVALVAAPWLARQFSPELSPGYQWLAGEFLPITEEGYVNLGREAARQLANDDVAGSIQAQLSRLLHDRYYVDKPQARRELLDIVAGMIAEDFSAGRVVLVDRWVLSRTQAVIGMSLLA